MKCAETAWKTTASLWASAALLAWGVLSPSLVDAQCSYEASTTPLIDLVGSYMGETGGLYGDGANTPPAALSTDAITRANAIRPIDGAIVMISVGMSNSHQEFERFVPMAMAHPDINPNLVIVDGAQGGEPAPAWASAGAPTWDEVDRRLSRAGVRAEQVRVAWVKQAVAGPRGGFPAHAEDLQAHLEDIARALRTNYPNIELAFYSSRSRACTDRGLNPEPYAYESAFSVRWMIDAQQSGDPTLDPSSRAPLLAWGPYLWAQRTPRSDGFSWPCSSVRTDDCTHPSTSGRGLVAGLLFDFFTTDPMAAPWFLREGAAPPSPDAGTPPADAGGPPDDEDASVPPGDAGEPPIGVDAGEGDDAGSGGDAGSRGDAGSGGGGEPSSDSGCSVGGRGGQTGSSVPLAILVFTASLGLGRRRLSRRPRPRRW